MSDFDERTRTTGALIDGMRRWYWEDEEIKSYHLVNQEYGYETHVPPEIQKLLRYRYSPTAKFIRFAPDSILCDEKNDYLLEYKVTKTPRYTFGSAQWEKGQIEADAMDNYLRLAGISVEVAVLFYCPYHRDPVLCGKPEKEWIDGTRVKPRTSDGSGTCYYNIHLDRVPRFEDFMEEKFHVPKTLSEVLIRSFLAEAVKNPLLQTKHARSSACNDGKHLTGFNWNSKWKAF